MSAVLQSIEGGRAIAARDCSASLQVDADSMATETENLAGYAVIVWDDEGGFDLKVHLGKRNPYNAAMLADVIRSRLASKLVEAEG